MFEYLGGHAISSITPVAVVNHILGVSCLLSILISVLR